MELKKLRKEKRLSQQKIAKLLNIDQKTYSNYENKKTEPSISTLIKLSELFNTSVDNLIKENPDQIILDQHPVFQQKLIKQIKELNQVQCAKVEAYIAGLKEGQKEYETIKLLNKYKGEQQ